VVFHHGIEEKERFHAEVKEHSHTNDRMKYQSFEGICEVSFSNQTTLEVSIQWDGIGDVLLQK
jgi:hypothetical protein